MPRRIPENTCAAAHDSLLRNLISETETRGKAFLEGVDPGVLAHAVAPGDQHRSRLRIKVGPAIRYLVVWRIEFIAQADIQRQFLIDAPIIGHIRAVFRATNADPRQQVILFDQTRCAEQERGHCIAARVVRRVVGDVRCKVEATIAAISLILGQMTAAHVQAGLDGVRAASDGQITHVLIGVFASQNRQRTAVSDARVTRWAEDRETVLLILLVRVGDTELVAELRTRFDVGLCEIKLEAGVSGAQIQHHARR